MFIVPLPELPKVLFWNPPVVGAGLCIPVVLVNPVVREFVNLDVVSVGVVIPPLVRPVVREFVNLEEENVVPPPL